MDSAAMSGVVQQLKLLSWIQGWPISFGVQSLLQFLAPFEIGYSEGQISSYLQEDLTT